MWGQNSKSMVVTTSVGLCHCLTLGVCHWCDVSWKTFFQQQQFLFVVQKNISADTNANFCTVQSQIHLSQLCFQIYLIIHKYGMPLQTLTVQMCEMWLLVAFNYLYISFIRCLWLLFRSTQQLLFDKGLGRPFYTYDFSRLMIMYACVHLHIVSL